MTNFDILAKLLDGIPKSFRRTNLRYVCSDCREKFNKGGTNEVGSFCQKCWVKPERLTEKLLLKQRLERKGERI